MLSWVSQVAQIVKNLPVVWKTWVRSLAWEDPLEKGMETYSNIIVWRFPWREEPGGSTVYGVAKSDMTEQLTHHTQTQCFLITYHLYLYLL